MVRTIRVSDLGGDYRLPEASEVDGWTYDERAIYPTTNWDLEQIEARYGKAETPKPKKKSNFNKYPYPPKKPGSKPKPTPKPAPKSVAKAKVLPTNLPKPVALDLGTKPKEVQIK